MSPVIPVSNAMPNQHRFGVRLIALFKLLEVLCFAMAAAIAFGLGNTTRLKQLMHWLQAQSIVDTRLGHDAMALFVKLGPAHFTMLGVLASAYTLLFSIEGIGLWLRRHWAEWLTVFATGSLIPYEAYTLWHHFGWIKCAVLLINSIIVWYLLHVVLQAHSLRRRYQAASR